VAALLTALVHAVPFRRGNSPGQDIVGGLPGGCCAAMSVARFATVRPTPVAEPGAGDQFGLVVGDDAGGDGPAEDEVGVAGGPVRGAGSDRHVRW
jgi:hypothetical protein